LTPVARVGGRALLVTPDDRVLLIHERLQVGTHWLTPGGGLEPGETPAAAAARETFEETGLEIVIPDDVPAFSTRRLWSWAGVDYDQIDHFFLARVPAAVPVRPRALTPMEQATLLEHRWWSVPELAATDEVLLPADLARVLGVLLPGAA
jgi:8-oxo-dGTP pyrophosphatase MutT (NUDIX family)